MKHEVCSKMWTDVNIRIPQKTLINCCKRQMLSPLTVAEIDQMGEAVLTGRSELISDKKNFIKTNTIPKDGCHECSVNQPNGYNSAHNEWRDRDWTKKELKDLQNQELVKYYEIMLSTTCNMACIYCNEKVSSTWADKLGEKRVQTNKTWKSAILKSMFTHMENNQNNNITINFLGGEPFLDLNIFDILESVVDIFEKKQSYGHRIMFTTNLNIKPKLLTKFFEIIEKTSGKFQWVMCPSVDAIGKYGEQIRVGLDWDLFAKNFELIMNNASINWVGLVPSISSLSIPAHYELLEWYIGVGLKSGRLLNGTCGISNNMINSPSPLHPNRLPSSYKKYVMESAKLILSYDKSHYDYLTTIEQLIGSYQKDELDVQNSLEYFISQSKIHNIDYLSIPVAKDILTKSQDVQ